MWESKHCLIEASPESDALARHRVVSLEDALPHAALPLGAASAARAVLMQLLEAHLVLLIELLPAAGERGREGREAKGERHPTLGFLELFLLKACNA